MKKKTLLHIFKNFAVLTAILVIIELIGHLSYRIYKGKFLFENTSSEKMLFQEHPYLVGVPKANFELSNEGKTITITTNDLGHRSSAPGTYVFNEDPLHIICLGGSTTFATGVSDQDSWPYLLQEKLGPGYRVFNLGVPGYATIEALIQMVSEVPELKPDILIYYQGWNDLKSFGGPADQKKQIRHGFLQRSNLKLNPKTSPLDFSFLNFMARKIRSRIQGTTPPTANDLTPDSTLDSLYVNNLRTLRALGAHLKTKQIFIPQVLNEAWYHEHQGLPNLWTPTIPNEAMPRMQSHFNSLMTKHIPTKDSVVTIGKILKDKEWLPEDFVDEGHFSRKGGLKFSALVYEAIEKLAEVNSTGEEIPEKQ